MSLESKIYVPISLKEEKGEVKITFKLREAIIKKIRK